MRIALSGTILESESIERKEIEITPQMIDAAVKQAALYFPASEQWLGHFPFQLQLPIVSTDSPSDIVTSAAA